MVPLQPWMTHGLAENSFTSEGMAAVRDSLRWKPYSPSSAARASFSAAPHATRWPYTTGENQYGGTERDRRW